MKLAKLVLIVILTFSGLSQAGNLSCKRFHEGEFYADTPEVGHYEVTRTGNIQTEVVAEQGIKVQYKVEWLSSCSYRLTLDKVINNDANAPFPPDMIITVEITETGSNYYKFVATSNKMDIKVNSVLYMK